MKPTYNNDDLIMPDLCATEFDLALHYATHHEPSYEAAALVNEHSAHEIAVEARPAVLLTLDPAAGVVCVTLAWCQAFISQAWQNLTRLQAWPCAHT